MTREEAIGVIKSECYVFNPLNLDRSTMINTALDMAIETLEQEPILDKIRVEIEHLRNFRAENYDLEQYCDSFDARIIFMEDVLQVIDKYKAESEDKK